ncbi:MAG: hypothetical protein IT410_01710 [Candidatus Doudnabacteria bacterium]|nr:hypothetical protein [Candidatus Doudnabacteria bacterium]
MKSEELAEMLRRRRGELETRIRNGYKGPSSLEVSKPSGEAFLVFFVPNSGINKDTSFTKRVKINNEVVPVMIRCGDKRFGITTKRVVKEKA